MNLNIFKYKTPGLSGVKLDETPSPITIHLKIDKTDDLKVGDGILYETLDSSISNLLSSFSVSKNHSYRITSIDELYDENYIILKITSSEKITKTKDDHEDFCKFYCNSKFYRILEVNPILKWFGSSGSSGSYGSSGNVGTYGTWVGTSAIQKK
jgi:hypothetical protein